MSHRPAAARSPRGFTLIEMIVVTLLLAFAMVGLLAVFDASARINKNENDVADAQGAVRYGIYQMTRVIRMAGSGGIYVTQAVLNHNDSLLPGITPSGGSYDNVGGAVSIVDRNGVPIAVRPGTDVIEVRGVIFSPLLGFDQQTGCNGCTGSASSVNVLPVVGDPLIGQHVNNNATNRPQFAAIDAYTAGIAGPPVLPMLVVVMDGNTDLHVGCSDPNPGGATRYPQPIYNVGVLNDKTNLGLGNTFGAVDFGGTIGPRFNAEMPSGASQAAQTIDKVRRAGILDDVIFFIALDPVNDPQGLHPYLAQGIRRGDRFDVTTLADDVEDMQVAYGVDTNGDSAITRLIPVSANDNDPNVSTVAGGDEWVPNVTGEAPFVDTDFQAQQPFVPGHAGVPPSTHCPRLHGVMISLLAKARDQDPGYRAPAASGYKIMNSTAAPVPGQFRRRVQTLKINLRNYAFQG
ncbi:MAG TPA: PilW family protein [Thermoanaerobaculia bacterium]|jgi:prepilin-type N-terminal cleavage/methylation domain-containing protein